MTRGAFIGTRLRGYLVFSSLGYNLIGRVFSLIAPLIVLPYMLEHLGDRDFAIWITGVAFTSLAAFLDFGVGNSLMTRLSASFAVSDTASSRKAIAASFKITVLIMSLLLLLLLAAVIFVHSAVPPLDIVQGTSINLAALVMTFFILGLPVALVQRILLADQRVVLFNALLVSQAFSSVSLALIGISADLENWAVVSMYNGSPVFFWMVVNIWYFWRFPKLRPSIAETVLGDDQGSILRLSVPYFFLSILMAVGMNADIPIILSTLGAESVADFALPARLGSVFLVVVSAAYIPLWALFGAAMTRGEYEKILHVSALLSVIGGAVILSAGLLTWLFTDQIIMAWADRAFADQGLVVLGFVFTSAVVALTSPWNMVLNAAGAVGIQVIAWTCFVIVSVASKLMLTSCLGAWAVGVITALSYFALVTLPVFLAAMCKLLGKRPA